MDNNTTYSGPTAAQPPGVVDKRPPFVMLSHELVLHIGNGRALLLYSILLSYANQTGRAHPSRETLAKHMGVKSTRTVDAALKDLEQLGLVSTFHRWHNEDRSRVALQADEEYKYQTSNGYILYDWAQRKPAQGGRTNMTPPGTQSSPPRGHDVAHKQEPVEQEPVEDKELTSGSGEPDTCDGDLFAAADAPQQQAPKPAPKLQRHTYTPEFEKFWKAYPTARGASKFETSERFAKALQYDTAENIIAGAERFADDPTRNPQYTPMPTTWLNKKRWTAEPDEVQQQVPQQPAQAPNPWAAYLDDTPTHSEPQQPDYTQGHTVIEEWS